MADEIKDEGNGQAPPPSPQEGTGNGQAPPAVTDDKTAQELAEARREAAAARNEKNKLQKQLDEIAAAQLSEAERLKKQAEQATGQVTALQEANRALHLQLAILRGAGTHKIDPTAQTAAIKLLDTSLLEWDSETGTPTEASVKKALEALVKENPFLVAKPDTQPAPPPGPHAPPPSGNGRIEPSARQQQVSGTW